MVIAVTKEIGDQEDTSNRQRNQPLSISKLQEEKELNVLTGLECFELTLLQYLRPARRKLRAGKAKLPCTGKKLLHFQ